MNLVQADLLDYVSLTFDSDQSRQQECLSPPDELGEWTVIIPFLNEEDFLAQCLLSVAAQSVPCELVLVDNGSVDRSCEIARRHCEHLGLSYRLLREPQRGKVYALARGLEVVRTEFVATFDADTSYPASYLRVATGLLKRKGCVGAQAYYTREGWGRGRCVTAAAKLQLASRLLPHQCHNGGAGQVFRTSALKGCGGFDGSRWSVALEDHEIIHRLTRLGRIVSDWDFWCCPSRRELDRPGNRWSILERLGYHLTPAQLQSRFLYDFLRPRLEARRPSVGADR